MARNLVGKRIRCISTDKIYRAVSQAGEEVVGQDEETGERVVLPTGRVVQHSPLLICVGAVIQTVILGDYAPIGESAYLIRGAFLGSIALMGLAWLLNMAAPVILLSYLAGGLMGLAASAAVIYMRRIH